MKIVHLSLVLSSLFLLTACPPSGYMQNAKKLRDNKMNFPEFYDEKFEGISFDLPSMFEVAYDDNFVLSEYFETFYISDLDLFFSVEKFTPNEIKELQFIYGENLSDLALLHRYYVKKREESLLSSITSTLSDYSKSFNIPTYIQVVNTNNANADLDEYDYYTDQSYFTASMKIDDAVFVFQMIGKEENMRYLYDDFIKILKSVR